MKHKTSKIKRVGITALAAVCTLSSAAAISANAATYEKVEKTVNGIHVYALAERYNSYSQISASCYSGPIDIKITMESQQKNSSGNWIYPSVVNNYSSTTSKSERINARSGYSVMITTGVVGFGGVGSYQLYKR